MAFLETPRFPDDISYGSTGGPGFSTDVVTVNSGHETRNQNWVQSRSNYNAAFGIRTEPQLSELYTFFQVMAGKSHEFRYKDWGDYMSCDLKSTPAQDDQSIGFGSCSTGSIADGQTEFQITKTYAVGIFSRSRDIKKPVGTDFSNSTVIVEVDNSLKDEVGTGGNDDYTVDYATGIISFVLGKYPLLDRGDGNPEEVKCGYEFDVPCRFDSDELNISFEAYAIGNVNVPIIEVRV